MQRADRLERQRGFSALELLITVAVIGIVMAAAMPVYREAIMKAHRKALVADGRGFYSAMMSYHADQGSFPDDSLELDTLDPLASEGYYSSAKALLGKLDGSALQLYLAPDEGAVDSEFVAVMRSARYPDIIVVVAHTGIITSANQFLDGVFVINEADLAAASELN